MKIDQKVNNLNKEFLSTHPVHQAYKDQLPIHYTSTLDTRYLNTFFKWLERMREYCNCYWCRKLNW